MPHVVVWVVRLLVNISALSEMQPPDAEQPTGNLNMKCDGIHFVVVLVGFRLRFKTGACVKISYANLHFSLKCPKSRCMWKIATNISLNRKRLGRNT